MKGKRPSLHGHGMSVVEAQQPLCVFYHYFSQEVQHLVVPCNLN